MVTSTRGGSAIDALLPPQPAPGPILPQKPRDTVGASFRTCSPARFARDPARIMRGSRMGRGRQKAKHTKVARELKYFSPNTDYSELERELSSPSHDSHDGWSEEDFAEEDSRA